MRPLLTLNPEPEQTMQTLNKPRSNRYPADCVGCGCRVPANTGTLSRARSGWTVHCPDCVDRCGDAPSEASAEALSWSKGNAVSYGIAFSTGERFTRNRRGRCVDAPCCGCCTI